MPVEIAIEAEAMFLDEGGMHDHAAAVQRVDDNRFPDELPHSRRLLRGFLRYPPELLPPLVKAQPKTLETIPAQRSNKYKLSCRSRADGAINNVFIQ